MPFKTNLGQHSPIEVFEDDTHLLVRIHPENRDRAKKIPGRQWDGNRKLWVYPKDQPTYEALLEEFKSDAEKFDIRRPKNQRPPGLKPPEKKLDDELEDQVLEEIRSLGDIGESQGKIYSELEEIRVMLESLRDDAANQNRTLEELRGTQEEATKLLNNLESSTQQTVKTDPVEVLPEFLNLTKQKEVELVEKALVMIACSTTGEKKSFCDWLNKHKPLSRPADFVNETHEFLKNQLVKIVGDEDPHTDFYNLIKRARDENVIFDPTIRPISILFSLNDIRNRFAHPPILFSQWEKKSKSILYLMNLALVWSKVVMEVEDCDE